MLLNSLSKVSDWGLGLGFKGLALFSIIFQLSSIFCSSSSVQRAFREVRKVQKDPKVWTSVLFRHSTQRAEYLLQNHWEASLGNCYGLVNKTGLDNGDCERHWFYILSWKKKLFHFSYDGLIKLKGKIILLEVTLRVGLLSWCHANIS